MQKIRQFPIGKCHEVMSSNHEPLLHMLMEGDSLSHPKLLRVGAYIEASKVPTISLLLKRGGRDDSVSSIFQPSGTAHPTKS